MGHVSVYETEFVFRSLMACGLNLLSKSMAGGHAKIGPMTLVFKQGLAPGTSKVVKFRLNFL